MLHCRCPARLAGWNWRTYPFDRTSSSTSAVLSFTFCRRRSGLVEELIREQHGNRRRRFRSLSRIHAKFFASHSLPSNATRQLSHSLSLSRTHTHTDTRTLSFTLSFAFFLLASSVALLSPPNRKLTSASPRATTPHLASLSPWCF